MPDEVRILSRGDLQTGDWKAKLYDELLRVRQTWPDTEGISPPFPSYEDALPSPDSDDDEGILEAVAATISEWNSGKPLAFFFSHVEGATEEPRTEVLTTFFVRQKDRSRAWGMWDYFDCYWPDLGHLDVWVVAPDGSIRDFTHASEETLNIGPVPVAEDFPEFFRTLWKGLHGR